MADAAAKLHIKNCYAEPWKTLYSDVRLATKQTESMGMACSYKFIAAPWDVGGGGVLGLINLSACGRNPPVTKLKGHTGSIQDLAFSPFYESILATASEDTTIRIWDAPDDGGEREVKDAVSVLSGSSKKLNAIEWNPVADFILASGCFDGVVSVWNADTGVAVSQHSLADVCLYVRWDSSGRLVAATSKDKRLTVIDPRTKSVAASIASHEGSKASKCVWMDGFAGAATPSVLTTGFSKNNDRELKLWDLRNDQTPTLRLDVDRGSQPLYPVFDETIGLLYIAGKGDGNMRYYQYFNGELKKVDEYRSNVPFKSFCFMPKLIVDQMRAEVGRMFKNENGKAILPVSFIVPRKNQDSFQADLYPPAPDADPALTADEWLSGKDGLVKRISMKPGDSVKFQRFAEMHKGLAQKSAGSDEASSEQAPPKTHQTLTRALSTQSPSVLQKNVERAQDETKLLDEELKAKERELVELRRRCKELEGEAAKAAQLEAKVKDQEAQLLEVEKREQLVSEKARRSDTLDGTDLHAEIESLRAQRDEASARAVAALKEAKAKEEELQKERSEKKILAERVADLERRNEELQKSANVGAAKGRSSSGGASLAGLEGDVKKEFDEMRAFFQEILDNTLQDLNPGE